MKKQNIKVKVVAPTRRAVLLAGAVIQFPADKAQAEYDAIRDGRLKFLEEARACGLGYEAEMCLSQTMWIAKIGETRLLDLKAVYAW